MLLDFIMEKEIKMKEIVFFKIFFITIFVSFNSYSQETYFDLSQDEIKIETNFDGKAIIIFGLHCFAISSTCS